MGKLKQLLGVAHNLADSFVSVTNRSFLNYIEFSLQVTKIEIDLLNEKIKPIRLTSKTTKNTLSEYQNWFFSELQKFKIDPKDIKKVIIKIDYKKGKSFGRTYICNVIITAKGKRYSKKVISSWA